MWDGTEARAVSLLSNPYRRRWLGWTLLVSAFFLVSLHRVSTAVLSEQLMRAFDTTATSLGFLHSSFFYLYALFQVPAGLLTDRYGARAIAGAGTGLMSLGALGFGLAPTYALAFLGRLCVGLGASVLFVAVLRFCANWYRPDEFGTMTGVTFTVGILGGLAATTPLAVAISTLGWRGTLAGLGLAGIGIAVGVVLFSHDSPTDAGLEPIDNVPERPEVTAGDLKGYVRDALGEAETWLLGIMLFFMTGIGITIFGLWGIPYLVQTYGISVTAASVYLLVGNVGGMIGPTLVGWLSDRTGRRTEFIVLAAVIFALTWGIFAVFGSIPLLLVGAVFLFSRILRGGIPLAFTVMKERHPEGASGTVVGLINTMGWTGAAVFPVILGAALDAYWTGETVGGTRVYSAFGYRVAFAISVAAGLIAIACAVALHVRTSRERSVGTGAAESAMD
jgi:sugar phosphate permease